MGKFYSVLCLILAVISCALLPSCGSSNPTKIAPQVLPTSVTINPSQPISLESGKTQAFTATPAPDTFLFESSNPNVLTIATNGLACAGTWNSLTAPTVCTPGPTGVAQVTASTLGVTSTPVTVYVHAPITSVAINKVAGQPQTLRTDCLSKGPAQGPESWLLEAHAFNGSTDITSSVGPFSWQQINPTGAGDVMLLTTPPNGTQGCLLSPQGQCLNQQRITASTPGVSQIYTTASGFNSQPISVETCRIEKILVSTTGDPTGSQTSFLVSSGGSTTLNATATDIAGQAVTNVPLTWSTSNPASVGISGVNTGGIFSSVGTASASSTGQGTVIASCTPPTCNAGIKPSLPIYPQAAINFEVENTSTTPAIPTAYATTTACTDPLANPSGAACTPTLVPITAASTTSQFAAGTPIPLPASPNTFTFGNSSSGSAYLGVDSTRFGQQGVMAFSGSTVSTATNVAGKVLAISPDTSNSTVIISDTFDTPNQLFICSNCSGSGRTVTSLLIKGATAAAFSPDSLKAYILAGSTLYVYSKTDPLQSIPLGGAATDVAFHPEGGFAFVSGPSNLISPYRTCDNSQLSSANLTTSNNPLILRALPDGNTLLALDPPNIDLISVTLSNPLLLCTGTLTDTSTSFNLGQGSFTPTQFFISPTGSTAYILGETSAGPPPTRSPFVVVFNIDARTSSVISLANSATPLSASLSPGGNLLFVGADDGAVHIVDTASGVDTQQVTFPFQTNPLCFGPGTPSTQVPLSQLKILGAAQNGSLTTYSYSLISGPPLKIGQSVTVSNMSDGGNIGTFIISALGTDASGNPTFTVTNSLGVTASNQSGVGTVPISCNPDLVVVKP